LIFIQNEKKNIFTERLKNTYLGLYSALISTPGIILMPNLEAADTASGMPAMVS
jgi:hypothetical protein